MNHIAKAEKNYSAVKYHNQLVILLSYTLNLKDGPTYFCSQFDFPLRTLTWFPKTLEDFRNGVKLKGIGGDGMTTPEINVDDEYLSINRTTTGYSLNNWSRNNRKRFGESFEPITLNFEEHFLYDDGFLDLWNQNAKKYESGTL